MTLEPTYSLKPRPCRYCQAPILWMEKDPMKWVPITPEGERHSCIGHIDPKRRRTHQFSTKKKPA